MIYRIVDSDNKQMTVPRTFHTRALAFVHIRDSLPPGCYDIQAKAEDCYRIEYNPWAHFETVYTAG